MNFPSASPIVLTGLLLVATCTPAADDDRPVTDDPAPPGDEAGETARIHATGIDGVHLGMEVEELRELGGRDSVWMAEGMREEGMVIEPRDGVPVLAVLSNGRAHRIVTRSPDARTDAGVGVSSRLGDLREVYGRTCVAVAEGRVVVWFPARPGVSFALDAAPAEDARSLPDEARVGELWVREGEDDCP